MYIYTQPTSHLCAYRNYMYIESSDITPGYINAFYYSVHPFPKTILNSITLSLVLEVVPV